MSSRTFAGLARLILSVVGCGLPALTPAQSAVSTAIPDISGIWQAMNTANWELEAHAAEAGPIASLGALLAVPGGIGYVEGGRIPYLPAALAKREENRAQRWSADPELKCFMPGVPRANYLPYPFQIIQGKDTLLFSYEFADAVRTVHLNDPGPAPAKSWMGWNVGHWESGSLVVDISSQHAATWLDRSGNYHSDKLQVSERYTPMGADILLYEATLTDPAVFSGPWTLRMPLYRHKEANAQLVEFKCIPFVESVLYDAIGR